MTRFLPATNFNEISSLKNEMDRLFSEFFREPVVSSTYPAVDMYEEDGSFIVEAAMPGYKKEDIDISVTGNVLTIKSKTDSKKEINGKNYYYAEIRKTNFNRSLRLPSTVDKKGISATYNNGILKISLPKKEDDKIAITVE